MNNKQPSETKQQEISLGNIYQINKQIMKDEPEISHQQLNKAKALLKYHFKETDVSMLLCNERKDYTVFINSEENVKEAIQALFECINNRGILQSIDKQPDGAYEIWIKIEDESYVYYLFDYSFGIIKY